MACTADFIEFVCSQIGGAGEVVPRKMFGDYLIYLNGKPVITACDNTCYVKKHPVLAPLMQEAETGCPSAGASEHYILDPGHRELALKTVTALWEVLPFPRSRRRE